MSRSIAEIAAELQGYDPQALSAEAVGEFLARLVTPLADVETVGFIGDRRACCSLT